MNRSKPHVDEDYLEAIAVLEKTLKYLEQLGLDAATTRAYRKIVNYLRDRNPEEIRRIMGAPQAKRQDRPKVGDSHPSMSDADIEGLKGEQVTQFLADSALSRDFLERIADVRFGVTKGALSTLRSKDALRNKLLTLLENEGTHHAIARAAALGNPQDAPSSGSKGGSDADEGVDKH